MISFKTREVLVAGPCLQLSASGDVRSGIGDAGWDEPWVGGEGW